jgi:hypothetical protein
LQAKDKKSLDIIYYEIRIERLNEEKRSLKYKRQFLISVKDISEFVKLHQESIHSMYKDAVLSNYSHEQLTPLNSILNHSILLVEDLNKINKRINEFQNNLND